MSKPQKQADIALGGRPPKGEIKYRPDRCLYLNLITKEQCQNTAQAGDTLCSPHIRTERKRGAQKMLRCANCPLLLRNDDASPDIEGTRKYNCEKAFWVSEGDSSKYMEDVCFWDRQSAIQPFDSDQSLLGELTETIRDLKLRINQSERILAAKGIPMTPDHQKMVQLYTDLLQAAIELRRPKNVFGKPGSVHGGINGGPGSFFDVLQNSNDGYEDGIKVTKTQEVTVQPVKKQPIEAKVVEAKPVPPEGVKAQSNALDLADATNESLAGGVDKPKHEEPPE